MHLHLGKLSTRKASGFQESKAELTRRSHTKEAQDFFDFPEIRPKQAIGGVQSDNSPCRAEEFPLCLHVSMLLDSNSNDNTCNSNSCNKSVINLVPSMANILLVAKA